MSDQKSSPSEVEEQPEVVNLSHADVETVTAEMVRMHQANAGTIHSDDVDMNVAAAGAVNAENVSARQSLIGGVNTDTAQVTDSLVGGVRGSNLEIEGVIGCAAGDVINVQNARVGLAAAREVRGQRVESLVLLAGRVEGEVHTVVDTRGAIIAGAIAGLVAGVMFLIGRGLSGGSED
jgi:hypothetical protein